MKTTQRNATFATFTIDRVYKSSPARVFAAWAQNEAKSQWFIGGPDWDERERAFNFRIGGVDRLAGVWKDGTLTDYTARYEEIVPDERIIFTYAMKMNDVPISFSLATVQFKPEGTGTRLLFTEQLTCIDGYDDPQGRSREHGTNLHLDRLEQYLLKADAAAV